MYVYNLDFNRASGDHAFAKIIGKYYFATFFYQFYFKCQHIFIATFLHQGILGLVLYGDLVINSK